MKECNCPEWVMRCVHYPDGSILITTDNTTINPPCGCYEEVPPPAAFGVALLPLGWDLPCPHYTGFSPELVQHHTPAGTEAEAIATFYSLEEALR